MLALASLRRTIAREQLATIRLRNLRIMRAQLAEFCAEIARCTRVLVAWQIKSKSSRRRWFSAQSPGSRSSSSSLLLLIIIMWVNIEPSNIDWIVCDSLRATIKTPFWLNRVAINVNSALRQRRSGQLGELIDLSCATILRQHTQFNGLNLEHTNAHTTSMRFSASVSRQSLNQLAELAIFNSQAVCAHSFAR